MIVELKSFNYIIDTRDIYNYGFINCHEISSSGNVYFLASFKGQV
jgi:hypothetical protein